MMIRFSVWFFALVLFFCCMPVQSLRAQEVANYSDFGAWPVLHDGRVKTLESFARSNLYQISGKTKIGEIEAIQWLAISLFDPLTAVSQEFIRVRPNDILELPDNRESHLYTMNEVMIALRPFQDVLQNLENRDASMLSSGQKEMLSVYYALSNYNQIIQSFSFVLPLAGHQGQSYRDGGGEKIQRELILQGGAENNLLKIIPYDNPSLPKISLWHEFNQGGESPIIPLIQSMANAWNDADYAQWNTDAKTIKNILQNADDNAVQLWLEHYYVTINPLFWVMILYLSAGLLIAFRPQLSMGFIIAGFAMMIHVASIILRSYILNRPPTGTLYETLLFGSAVVIMVGFGIFKRNKSHYLFFSLCSISAAFLLYVSRGFIQGDSLNVLVAVLNTNFWLSTHVTCIIIGYAFCIIAAVVGHMILWSPKSESVRKLVMPLLIAALLFTSVGTLLGGIWADQSWGRFWGWDPKENGALLIVLWLVWILHGRICGQLKITGFAAFLALTNIMVALTWFGVNLLGVGLHSYGFISGIAWGLGSFILLQILIVVGLYFRARRLAND